MLEGIFLCAAPILQLKNLSSIRYNEAKFNYFNINQDII